MHRCHSVGILGPIIFLAKPTFVAIWIVLIELISVVSCFRRKLCTWFPCATQKESYTNIPWQFRTSKLISARSKGLCRDGWKPAEAPIHKRASGPVQRTSNLRANEQIQTYISRLWDLSRSYDNLSLRLVNNGPRKKLQLKYRMDIRALFQYPMGRFIVRSREVSKPRNWFKTSLGNVTGTSAALLPMCLSNFRAIV